MLGSNETDAATVETSAAVDGQGRCCLASGAWPLQLSSNSARASIAAVILDPLYADADDDGVADSDELPQCKGTPAGRTVDERGCSYEQRRGQ